MEPLHTTAVSALQRLLAGQPTTPAKIGFAWRMAAGPALGRATSTRWTADGTLHVRAESAAWRREAARAKPVVADRLRRLLGPDVVRRIIIDAIDGSER